MAQHYRQDREARQERDRVRGYQARRAVFAHTVRRRARDNLFAGAGFLVVIVLLVVAQVFYFAGGPGTPATSDSASETPTDPNDAGENSGEVPSSDLAANRTWTGTLTINDVPLGIELDGALAPQAVSSMVSLIQADFYPGVSCHRLTTGGFFVLQCGDPNAADTTGELPHGPGYSYGPIENAPADNVYPAGTLAMARQGDDAFSHGSQFFIVYEDTTIPSDAAGGYTVLGTVTSGLDELQAAVIEPGVADGTTDGPPTVPTTITAVTVQ